MIYRRKDYLIITMGIERVRIKGDIGECLWCFRSARLPFYKLLEIRSGNKNKELRYASKRLLRISKRNKTWTLRLLCFESLLKKKKGDIVNVSDED
ncbi:hypothetical protein AVEN_226823-1 [Araneus ventricosus]|uniref:Uncharacterized protein n=1 Tax=Araneus ventricosus TaxID=182803 RepID=A0A4Y2RKH2_ARAVE|nr:hypothetical protein AVEN_226823-1 [Araneus ventricosus]